MFSLGMINNKYKTSMCRHFEQTGICQLGSRCHFAHSKEELRKVTDPISVSSAITAKTPIPTTSGYPVMTTNNYKTVKCKYFEQGFCKYTKNCSFAHGETDIRMPTQVPISQTSIAGYQASTLQQYPLMDPTIQNQIAQQQIQYLIQQMESYHSSNPILMVNIKKSQELNTVGNTQAAAQLLYEIIQRPEKSDQDTEKYNEFLTTIQQLGNILYQSVQLSVTQTTTGYGYQSNMITTINNNTMGAYPNTNSQVGNMGINQTNSNIDNKGFGSK